MRRERTDGPAHRGPGGDADAGAHLGPGGRDADQPMQALFARALEDQGNAVTYKVMPGSNHDYVSHEGWPVFLDAFKRAATAGG